jgi:hypothetical protein
MLFRCIFLGRCPETNVISKPFASNGSFSGSTVVALSKYATVSNTHKIIFILVLRYKNIIKVNGIIKGHFGKHTTEAKLRMHNITSKAALCYGSEIIITNKGLCV